MNTSRRTSSGLSTRVVRSVDDLHPGTAELVRGCGAPFYYGAEFLRAYERHAVQPVHDVFYVEVLDRDETLVGFTPCYVQGDPLGALGLAQGELAVLTHTWHCPDTRLVCSS